MQCVKPCVKLVRPASLAAYKRKGLEQSDFEQFTTLELISVLKNDGWVEQTHKKSKRLAAYRDGAEQRWYKTTGTKVNKHYLMALAVSRERFRAGLIHEVHRFQPMNYYQCIYQGYKNVLPNQPLSYYKALRKGQQPSSKRPHSDREDNLEEGASIEDDH